jgi:serine protease AprX
MGSGLVLRSPLGLILAVLGLTLAAVGPAQAAPMAADLDRDAVFDDLESRVRAADPGRRLRVIVTLESDATARRAVRLENRVESFDVTRRYGIVDAYAAVVDAGAVRDLAAQPGVAHVEKDAVVRATNASAQESFGVAKARLDVPSLDGDADGSPATYSPADLVAAVVDTGIDPSHVNLDGGKVLTSQNFSSEGDPGDLNGHGTHVAATVAGDGDGDGSADGRGVAPGAGLVSLKVLDANGEGSSSGVLAAIDWVLANGATYGIEAINLSLGAEGCSDGTDAESLALNEAAGAGYVVAVAAGNDGPAGCTATTGISSPAAAADAITVGAMADVGAGGFFLAGFSSRGPTLDGRVKPDVAGPGVGIRSAAAGTTDGYAVFSGTSMATPFVAGVALLMRDLNPSLTAAQVKQTIMQTAVDWGSPGADSDYGAGRLDAYAALADAKTPTALLSPPAVPAYQRVQSTLTSCAAPSRTYTITGAEGIPLTVGLTVAGSGLDFDMYLYADPSQEPVAKAETPHRQDELHLSSGAGGPYLLDVRSFSGSGIFFLDVSGATGVESPPSAAPENTSAPTTTGSGKIGSTLTGGPGCWKGNPAFTYEWERCNADGTGCAGTGDVDTSYEVTKADAGRAMRFVVFATNAAGSSNARGSLIPVISPPPVNTAPPGLEGDPRVGATLAATPGTWDSLDPVALSFAWERCNTSLTTCTPIAGASGSRYTPTSGDVASRLRAVETATNAAGSQRATSAATGSVAPALRPPSSGGPPTVTGTARHGRTLQLSAGTWGGLEPIAFAYGWLRCNAEATECAVIAGAGDERYRLGADDVGSRIVGRVVASNSEGRGQADSVATAVVAAARPASRDRPAVSGPARRGRLLRVHGGAWWGTPTLSFRVQWLRCSRVGTRCRPIESATRAVYVPRAADIGHRLRARVTATGPGGSRRTTSLATGIVRRLPRERPAVPRGARRMEVDVADASEAPLRSVTTRLAAARG